MSELEREKFEARFKDRYSMAREHGQYFSIHTRDLWEVYISLRAARSASSPTRESLRVEWMAQEEYLDWSNFLLHKLTDQAPSDLRRAKRPDPLCLNCGTSRKNHRLGDDHCPNGKGEWADTVFATTQYSAGEAGSPASAPTVCGNYKEYVGDGVGCNKLPGHEGNCGKVAASAGKEGNNQ